MRFQRKLLLTFTVLFIGIVLVACGKSDEEILEGSWTANTQNDLGYNIFTIVFKDGETNSTFSEYDNNGNRKMDTSYEGTYVKKGSKGFILSMEEDRTWTKSEGLQFTDKEDAELITKEITIIDEGTIEIDGTEFEKLEGIE